MKLTTFSLLSTFFLSALAIEQTPPTGPVDADIVVIDNAPAAPSASASLSKRQAPETVILSNCDPAGTYGSYFYYYKAGHDANGGYDDACGVQGGSFVTWEGRSISCRFNSGVTFTSSIVQNAQSQADFTIAGSGSNGFRSFTCRKDNKRVHFSGSGFSCRSIYYCQ
ncbi:hypothetical protein BU26DRAFT_509481 [Trematosphaeria pertusa]|uniref:AA1-like domain-containing protein n=1 Tax=Trematosphaeria pertusa TaxID=390896 RepID=A0A6A6HZL7_9PLEO|nr:uncharacterized protein BU26DRAFT_509481 [Trematosphaeria pertusa]KAF2243674.1 hypothetical protein BU26DRAFT_509481 [Trematosphaeria pertusa]